jgi:hypothetical protein
MLLTALGTEELWCMGALANTFTERTQRIINTCHDFDARYINFSHRRLVLAEF